MIRNFLLSLIVVALCVTGCTGAPAPAPTPTVMPPTDTASPVPTQPPTDTPTPVPPTATPTPVPPTATPTATLTPIPPTTITKTLETGWILYQKPSAGFAIALPPTWEQVDLDVENLDTILSTLGGSNPEMATLLKGQGRTLIASGFKFWGFDLTPEAAKAGFLTNVNVLKQPLTIKASLDFYVQATLTQLEDLSIVIKPISHRRVKLAGGDAEEIRYQMKVVGATGKTVTTAVTQYLLITEKDVYVISFGTVPEQTKKYVSIFEKIAQSFELNETARSTATVPPTSTSKSTPRPSVTSTKPPATSLKLKELILTQKEIAAVLPLVFCIMNMYQEDETFSGYMCFANSQAVGAKDATMFTITLETGSKAQGGAEIPVPKTPGLPPDLRMTMTDDLSLAATAGGRSLLVSLSGGDPQIARKLLTDIAVLQFVKIQRLTR